MELPPKQMNEVIVGDITRLAIADWRFLLLGNMDGFVFASCHRLGSDGNNGRRFDNPRI
jgi:hypothetical protein